MKVMQRVTLLGGVVLTLLLLLYSFHFYSTYNIKPLPLSGHEEECPPVTSPCSITTDMTALLGNKLLWYWLLIAAAKRHNCTAYLSPNMAGELLLHFRITTPVLAPEDYYTTAWTFVDVQNVLSNCRAKFPSTNLYLIGVPYDYRNVFPYVEDVRRELIMEPEVVDRAQQKLSGISRMKRYKIFVSVHARRGDIAKLHADTRQLNADPRFYASAMDHFRSKYGEVAFVVVCDIMEWCRENIKSSKGDVFYEGGGSAIDDFALLANCNHSVIGYSTFAYSAAILAGGDVVYHANYAHPENAFYNMHNLGQLALDHWIPIDADLSQLPPLSPPEESAFHFLIYVATQFAQFGYFQARTVFLFAFNALFYLPHVLSAA